MKNQIKTALKTLGFAGMFCGLMLRAQDAKSEIAKVPFAFHVGAASMPAGTYAAIKVHASGVVRMENRASGKSVMAAAFLPKSGKAGQSKLAFRCYENNGCFLSEIWYADETSGHALATSPRERELMASHQEPQLTYIAMR
jgi:hypothetical protein